MPFSARSGFDLRPNRWSRLLAERRARGDEVIDLTASNPTACGFTAPGSGWLRHLCDPAAARYRPEPFGRPETRAAVAAYHAQRGDQAAAGRVVLTASSSEAYAWLLKLLADPGDEVLIPQPGYPLLDFLAGLEGVVLRPYPLVYDGGWGLDRAALRAAVGPRTRAVILVSPNNPTGSVVGGEDLAFVDGLGGERGLAVISDEVFAEFPFADGGPPWPAAAGRARLALTFSLAGLSKLCGLPQAKLGWILAGGPEDRVAEALGRLEVIADTYLSVSTAVQVAAPALLAERGAFLAECRGRVRANRAWLAAQVREGAAALLAADGGWYACLRLPRVMAEEELALQLLGEDGVAVHPGYFFDFPGEGYLVVSLIVPPEELRRGVERVLARVG